MSGNIVEDINERHFTPCFEMLTQIISSCPDDLWEGRGDELPIWQIICHALAGSWVWFRPTDQPFQEPPMGEAVAELKVTPQEPMTRQEVSNFAAEAMARAQAFFSLAEEAGPLSPYSFYPKLTNLDVIIDQVRHIQHHVGYCNKILGERGAAIMWQGVKL